MKTTLCTLYNSLYLDKGLVLYDSLKECASDFELYVLCMDDKCFEVLSDIKEENLKPIRLAEVENEAMLIAKGNRSMAEYCWTCSSRFIQYILETFHTQNCTYVDADMYFYQDPKVLIDEMLEAGKSVMVVPHRFSKANEYLQPKVGKFCVEFNTFLNNEQGLKVLNHWHNQCLECCSNIGDGIHWGDQKYLDEWPVLFPDIVHECNHLGAGIAPWNIEKYQAYNFPTITVKQSGEQIEPVFYHYQSVSYISRKEVNTGVTNSPCIDKEVVKGFYTHYLTKIDCKKQFLEDKYHLNTLIKTHPSYKFSISNLLKRSSFIRRLWHQLHKNSADSSIIIRIR